MILNCYLDVQLVIIELVDVLDLVALEQVRVFATSESRDAHVMTKDM